MFSWITSMIIRGRIISRWSSDWWSYERPWRVVWFLSTCENSIKKKSAIYKSGTRPSPGTTPIGARRSQPPECKKHIPAAWKPHSLWHCVAAAWVGSGARSAVELQAVLEFSRQGPPLRLWRTVCFTQLIRIHFNLILKCSHRNSWNNVWPTAWLPQGLVGWHTNLAIINM